MRRIFGIALAGALVLLAAERFARADYETGVPSSGGASEHDFSVHVDGNANPGTALAQTKCTNASTLTADSTITSNPGTDTGSVVMKLCSDGTTCGAGNVYLTCTGVCNATTATACTVTKAAVSAATTLTWKLITNCDGIPSPNSYNVVAHFTTP